MSYYYADSRRRDIAAELEAPVREYLANEAGWEAPEVAATAMREIIARLDEFDATEHDHRRRNFIIGLVRDTLRERVEATRRPLPKASVKCSDACSRWATWTLDVGPWKKIKPDAPAWGRKPEDYVTVTDPKPYCGQHATKAVTHRTDALVNEAGVKIGLRAGYAGADVRTAEQAHLLADSLGIEIDPAMVEAVK